MVDGIRWCLVCSSTGIRGARKRRYRQLHTTLLLATLLLDLPLLLLQLPPLRQLLGWRQSLQRQHAAQCADILLVQHAQQLHAPRTHQGGAQVAPYVRRAGVQLQRAHVEARRLVVVARVGERDAHVGPRAHVVGLEVERALVRVHRLTAARVVGQRGAHLVPQRVVARPQLERRLERRDGGRVLARQVLQHAQRHQQLRVTCAARARRRRLKHAHRVAERLAGVGRRPCSARDLAVHRVVGQPRGQVAHRLPHVELVGVRHAQREPHIRVGRVGLQRAQHGGDGLLVVVVLSVHRAQQPPRLRVVRPRLHLRLQRQRRLAQHAAPEQVLALGQRLVIAQEGVVGGKHVLALGPCGVVQHVVRLAQPVHALPLLEHVLVAAACKVAKLLRPRARLAACGRLLRDLRPPRALQLFIYTQVQPLAELPRKLVRPRALRTGPRRRLGCREVLRPLRARLRGLRPHLHHLVVRIVQDELPL
mmetsp:Transcript_27683/g.70508  ORF Transcript_27683/g.70508 Transcript_27683/m.70508 type:complete len:477 (-) Transcript_27683:1306-2736(-)